MRRIITIWASLFLAAGLLTGCTGENKTADVTTASAKSGKDLSAMVWQGEVEALSSIDVLPAGSGKVVEISAAEGQHVEKGDLLFRLDDTDAALSLAQAQASCDAAASAFNNAKKTRDKNLSVTPAQIAYHDAKNNFDRMQELFNTNTISQVDYENAKSRMDTAGAQLEAAKNGQQAGYDSAKAQLDSAKAALDIAAKRLTDCSVTAPITGIVAMLNIETGQTITPQTPAAAIMDDSGEKVEIKVADTDIGLLQNGMPMTISLQSTGTTLTGSITRISPICDPQTGMYTVTVLLDGNNTIKASGLTADIRATTDKQAGAVYIPAKCITTEDGESCVYTVKNKTAAKTPITPGRKKNAYIEITQGLTEGDQIILQSSQKLKDGMKVHILTVQ